MTSNKKKSTFMWLFVGLLLIGCIPAIEQPVELDYEIVSTPSSFDEALAYMEDYSVEKRIEGMWAVINYPDNAEEAIPLLIQNLYYETTPDIRAHAARILGVLGKESIAAVPDLIQVAQNDTSLKVQIEAATALGSISDRKAVPVLAQKMYQDDIELGIVSANAISQITGLKFSEANSQVYTLDENGVPLVVIAVQTWWEEEGQYQDWSNE